MRCHNAVLDSLEADIKRIVSLERLEAERQLKVGTPCFSFLLYINH
jgi:hypothetical protein